MATLESVTDKLKKASDAAGLVMTDAVDDAPPDKDSSNNRTATVEVDAAPLQLLTQYIGSPESPSNNGFQWNLTRSNSVVSLV